jgi:ParB-like nuclease domain
MAYSSDNGNGQRVMPGLLEPYPFSGIFPELPAEELRHLAQDIQERGQIEPIILYKGQILDGRNRYKACRMVGVNPRFEEFKPKTAKRSPEEFVLGRNLRRRHLSTGQKAAIALEWADQLELSPRAENAKNAGRPRGALLEAAKHIGIERQRVFEARQIRETNAGLYRELKAGRRSLNSVWMRLSLRKKRIRASLTRLSQKGARAGTQMEAPSAR